MAERIGPSLGELRARRDDIARVAARHGMGNLRVFGSVARGTTDERSDVDLLIEFVEPRPRGIRYFGALYEAQEELARLLGHPVHISEARHAESDVGRRILREAIPL